MAILPSPPLPSSSFFKSYPKPFNFLFPPRPHKPIKPITFTCAASIEPPPTGFDFRSSDVFSLSRATISESYPELLDLVDMGCLILIQKEQFGPVPKWRAGFVEPEEIWLLGTTHIDRASALHVDRVVRALRPDNVVVELCRSRFSSSELGLCTLPATLSQGNG
uniref:TraB domain-containing protein n=1 Tax=Opuntia streptacantha TaxID=393608 RepID=A0A7C9AJG9_OPUST